MTERRYNGMRESALRPGDVVQMAPDCTNLSFAACFMVVEEITDWGVKGYLPTFNGQYVPYRETHGKFYRVGRAEWLLKESA